MSKAALTIISNAMSSLGLIYSFMEHHVDEDEEVVYPYFVGEYQEVPTDAECGENETQFILTGFSRPTGEDDPIGALVALEDAKEKIASLFNKVGGETVIADNGSAVAVFYSHSLVVPTGDAELKKIQINLTIKEWSVK